MHAGLVQGATMNRQLKRARDEPVATRHACQHECHSRVCILSATARSAARADHGDEIGIETIDAAACALPLLCARYQAVKHHVEHASPGALDRK